MHGSTTSNRRAILFVAVSVLFLIVVLSATLQGTPTFNPPQLPGLPPVPRQTETAAPAESSDPLPDSESETVTAIIGAVLATLVVIVALVLLLLLVRFLLALWRNRPLPEASAGPIDVGTAGQDAGEPLPDEAVVRRGIVAASDSIDLHERAGDAIVAAWLALEETAADAGRARAASETPGEFTVRILEHRPVVAEPTRALLTLFQRVRFGEHVADESDRAKAAAALREISEGWR